MLVILCGSGYQSDVGYGLLMMTEDDEGTGRAELLGVGRGFRVLVSSRTPGRHVVLPRSTTAGIRTASRWRGGV